MYYNTSIYRVVIKEVTTYYLKYLLILTSLLLITGNRRAAGPGIVKGKRRLLSSVGCCRCSSGARAAPAKYCSNAVL